MSTPKLWRQLEARGEINSSGEVSKDEGTETGQQPVPAAQRTEWAMVQQELEAERRRRENARLKAATWEDKSLYEILQANKAAKQAAFEEQHRLKNQFRALDDDEVGFLDEVRERSRREEERVRRETEEGLRAFRARQRSADGDKDAEQPLDDEAWALGRKRKRASRDRDVRGLRRKPGDAAVAASKVDPGHGSAAKKEAVANRNEAEAVAGEAAKRPPGENKARVLVDYGSGDSDDD